MSKYERLGAILELLGRDGSLDVDVAAAELHVSAATIRRDLDLLSKQQLLTRTHGGAVSNNAAYDLPLRYKAARHASEKQRIGKAVAEMIAAGTIVGLNGGTTTTEVARALALRGDPQLAYHPSITVVTNSLNIATELAVRAHLKIVVTGGVARPQSYELVGPLAGGGPGCLPLDPEAVRATFLAQQLTWTVSAALRTLCDQEPRDAQWPDEPVAWTARPRFARLAPKAEQPALF